MWKRKSQMAIGISGWYVSYQLKVLDVIDGNTVNHAGLRSRRRCRAMRINAVLPGTVESLEYKARTKNRAPNWRRGW